MYKEIFESQQKKREKEEEIVAGEIKTNPRRFFSYASTKEKKRKRVGPLKTEIDGKVTFERGEKKMAEILSKQYESVFNESEDYEYEEEVGKNVAKNYQLILGDIRHLYTRFRLGQNNDPKR